MNQAASGSTSEVALAAAELQKATTESAAAAKVAASALDAGTADAARVKLSLAERMLSQFWDDATGGFFYTSGDHEALIARNKETHDNATPSGNRPMGLTLREYGQAHQSVSEVTELVRVRVDVSRPQLLAASL